MNCYKQIQLSDEVSIIEIGVTIVVVGNPSTEVFFEVLDVYELVNGVRYRFEKGKFADGYGTSNYCKGRRCSGNLLSLLFVFFLADQTLAMSLLVFSLSVVPV